MVMASGAIAIGLWSNRPAGRCIGPQIRRRRTCRTATQKVTPTWQHWTKVHYRFGKCLLYKYLSTYGLLARVVGWMRVAVNSVFATITDKQGRRFMDL